MPIKYRARVAEIISDFTGIYARVARRLNVSQSLVSKVAHGHRASPEIDECAAPTVESVQEQTAKVRLRALGFNPGNLLKNHLIYRQSWRNFG